LKEEQLCNIKKSKETYLQGIFFPQTYLQGKKIKKHFPETYTQGKKIKATYLQKKKKRDISCGEKLLSPCKTGIM
jgi:hypothetical protein